MEETHIAAVGYDADVIQAPLQQYDPTRLHLLRLLPRGMPGDYSTSRSKLDAWTESADYEVVIHECELTLDAIHERVHRIAQAEVSGGNRVLLNISSGPRLFTTAAALVSSRVSVELYYVERQTYYVQRDFTSGIERVIHLPSLVPRMEEVQVDSTLCFVLMPFLAELLPIFEDIIQPTVEGMGLRCVRADDVFDNRPIVDDIWQNIREARVIIADLTHRNPNVFYETGIAHAVGKEVILLAQDLEDVPFDLRHLRCVLYSDTHRGADKLRDSLGKTLATVLARSALATQPDVR